MKSFKEQLLKTLTTSTAIAIGGKVGGTLKLNGFGMTTSVLTGLATGVAVNVLGNKVVSKLMEKDEKKEYSDNTIDFIADIVRDENVEIDIDFLKNKTTLTEEEVAQVEKSLKKSQENQVIKSDIESKSTTFSFEDLDVEQIAKASYPGDDFKSDDSDDNFEIVTPGYYEDEDDTRNKGKKEVIFCKIDDEEIINKENKKMKSKKAKKEKNKNKNNLKFDKESLKNLFKGQSCFTQVKDGTLYIDFTKPPQQEDEEFDKELVESEELENNEPEEDGDEDDETDDSSGFHIPIDYDPSDDIDEKDENDNEEESPEINAVNIDFKVENEEDKDDPRYYKYYESKDYIVEGFKDGKMTMTRKDKSEDYKEWVEANEKLMNQIVYSRRPSKGIDEINMNIDLKDCVCEEYTDIDVGEYEEEDYSDDEEYLPPGYNVWDEDMSYFSEMEKERLHDDEDAENEKKENETKEDDTVEHDTSDDEDDEDEEKLTPEQKRKRDVLRLNAIILSARASNPYMLKDHNSYFKRRAGIVKMYSLKNDPENIRAIVCYNKDGELERKGNPAITINRNDGTIDRHIYFLYGVPHRPETEGPAYIEYYPNEKIKKAIYCRKGRIWRRWGPAYIEFDEEGNAVVEKYYINGKEYTDMDKFDFYCMHDPY